MTDFCILGSGIAGSTIANLLSKKYTVHVFDKARGPGGRASNKRFIGNLSFDHGVQYISPDTKQFKKFINQLYKKNLLKVWSGNHIDFTFEKKEIKNKFIGKKGNNVISKYNLKNIKKNYHSQIKKITFKNNCWILKLINNDIVKTKSLILTCPFPQLKTLAKNYLTKKILNLKINMEPNITVMIVIKNQKQIPVSSIKFNDDILAWAAFENSKKRFKSSNALWTLQSTTKWARKKTGSPGASGFF